MPRIHARPTSTGATVVFCEKARVGYVVARGADSQWIWEFCMRSEVMDGLPRGYAPDRSAAIGRVAQCFRAWCRAAGLPEPILEIDP